MSEQIKTTVLDPMRRPSDAKLIAALWLALIVVSAFTWPLTVFRRRRRG